MKRCMKEGTFCKFLKQQFNRSNILIERNLFCISLVEIVNCRVSSLDDVISSSIDCSVGCDNKVGTSSIRDVKLEEHHSHGQEVEPENDKH